MKSIRFLCFILFLSVNFSFSAQTKKSDSLSILFIGNSFTHMNDMPSIFSKIAVSKGKAIHVEKNTQSGASFRLHSTRLDMFAKINSRKWDYIVLQGYSRELSHPKEYIDTATIPFINQIIDTIRNNNACTNMYFYNTWGYKKGFTEREDINTYEKMQDSIISGYKYISDFYNIPIVPVGMVWRKVIITHPELNLYAEDEAHPNRLGSYLSACTFYAAVFNESPVGALTSTISFDNADIIQQAAADVVLKNFNLYNLDLNTSSVKYFRTKNANYMVVCKSNYPKAKSITWDFGNGKTSNESKVTHEYQKPGKYTIKLIVDDECGVRTITRKVSYEAPLKPKKPQKSKPKKNPTTNKKI
jgi:hypothetical protein